MAVKTQLTLFILELLKKYLDFENKRSKRCSYSSYIFSSNFSKQDYAFISNFKRIFM